MKKFIAIAVSAIFLLGFAATAFAIHADIPTGTQAVYAASDTQLKIGGDMRVRGTWKNNFDFNNNAQADSKAWDQRYRLSFIVKTDQDIEARMRAVFGNNYTWGTAVSGVSWDWAYLHIPMGAFSVDIGRQRASWGHKFMTWDNATDRIKVIGHVDGILWGLFTDKIAENSPPAGQDMDQYGALVISKGENVTLGVIGIYRIDDAVSTNDTGYILNTYGTAGVGDVTIMGEVVLKGGGLFQTTRVSDGKTANQYGGFIAASIPMDAFTFTLAAAVTRNGLTADNYFAPTLFLGTVNPTAIMDFGANGDTTAVAGTAKFQVSDATYISGTVAWAKWKQYDAADALADASAFEFDVTVKTKIAKNTTYEVNVGVLAPSDFDLALAAGSTASPFAANDTAIAVGHKIQMKF